MMIDAASLPNERKQSLLNDKKQAFGAARWFELRWFGAERRFEPAAGLKVWLRRFKHAA